MSSYHEVLQRALACVRYGITRNIVGKHSSISTNKIVNDQYPIHILNERKHHRNKVQDDGPFSNLSHKKACIAVQVFMFLLNILFELIPYGCKSVHEGKQLWRLLQMDP